MKTCRVCRELLPLSAFGPVRKSRDRLAYDCRACGAARTARWQRANPEKKRAKGRAWMRLKRIRAKAALLLADPSIMRIARARAHTRFSYRLSAHFDKEDLVQGALLIAWRRVARYQRRPKGLTLRDWFISDIYHGMNNEWRRLTHWQSKYRPILVHGFPLEEVADLRTEPGRE